MNSCLRLTRLLPQVPLLVWIFFNILRIVQVCVVPNIKCFPFLVSSSSRVTAPQEFPIKERPPGYYSHPHRISVPKPIVDTSMAIDSDSEEVAAPFRELSIQPVKPAPTASMTPALPSASLVKSRKPSLQPVEPEKTTLATSVPPSADPVKTAISPSKGPIGPKPTPAVSQKP